MKVEKHIRNVDNVPIDILIDILNDEKKFLIKQGCHKHSVVVSLVCSGIYEKELQIKLSGFKKV